MGRTILAAFSSETLPRLLSFFRPAISRTRLDDGSARRSNEQKRNFPPEYYEEYRLTSFVRCVSGFSPAELTRPRFVRERADRFSL